MLIQDSVTLFAVFGDSGFVCDQDNRPLLVEEDSPPSGSLWQWTASGFSGFGGPIAGSFTHADDGVGGANELHKEANLVWSGIQPTTWENGASGHFTLTLDDGTNQVTRTVYVTLRSIRSIDFTVLEGQSYAGVDSICAAPGSGSPYTWASSGASGIVPAPTIGFSFDAGDTNREGGKITVGCAGDWSDQNGKFTLSIQDGAREASVFNGSRNGADHKPKLSLRKLLGDGYTLIDGQVLPGGAAVSEAGATAAGFTFTPTGLSGFATTPTNFKIENPMGCVTACACADWNQSGEFKLTVKDGGRPESVFDVVGADNRKRKLTLRSLAGDGYTLIDGQVFPGGEGMNAVGATVAGFTFTPSGLSGFATTPTNFKIENPMGCVTACACADWNQSGTFTLTAADGSRPASVVAGLVLALRHLSHKTIYWFNNQTAVDPTTINGNPSGASYDWSSSDARVVISNGGGIRIGERITGSGITAGTDLPFNLTITDGTRPGSVIPCTLKARHVTDPINIPYSASSGSETVEVTGDSVTEWNFGAGVFSSIESVLSFNGGVGNTASISWGDNALNNDDSGTLTFTIQPNDASAPSCTVLVNINISVTTNIVDTTKPTVIDCTFEIV
jgi:hypothetical protein